MKLSNIKVNNFKSLKEVSINLSNLTLITGVNSSGKSSLIQVLLLIKENANSINRFIGYQSFIKGVKYNSKNMAPEVEELGKDIKIEIPSFVGFGDYVNLGNKKDLLHQECSRDEKIAIELYNDADNYMKVILDNDFNVDFHTNESEKLSNGIFSVFYDDIFVYLHTDRAPPAITFPFSEKYVTKNSIGSKGEYTAHYLSENSRKILAIKALKHPKSETTQLLENVSKWLGEISNGVSVLASANPSTQSVKLVYQYKDKNNISTNYSSLNVGFGLTYVLPVIVLILKSKPGDFLIIENPESHLHPAGQSKIAELCAIAASNGVQIIIETHSDHFLNGLRVATKNNIIKASQSQIYYFHKKENNLDTIAQPLNIDKKGKIDNWPVGFFDEWDNQLDKLLW